MTRTNPVSIDSRHHSWILAARGQVEDSELRSASSPRRRAPSGPALPADFFPGYELLGEVHRGGQGIVYRATQKSTGRTVAIKMLREAAFAGPTERARFEREVQILAALKHPNIVTIHDSGDAAGHLYFVMDYIAGQPLDVHVAREKRPIRDVLQLFVTICDAVNAAHVLGIVHRDLKPGNIRVGPDGTPYVLDFGLARLADAVSEPDDSESPTPMTATGQFVGSLPWATPEQADGNPAAVDRRSDVYSLGVILYQVLTGRFPYSVTGRMRRILESIAQTPPADPRSVAAGIDDEVSTLVLTCLAKDPARRYQSAGDLAADLRRYLAGEPIAAKRDSTWYVLRKSAARHRAPIAAATAVMLLLILSTAVCWSLMLRARQSEHDARENLRESLLSQARARRQSITEGRRFESLAAIARAAAIRPGVDLRNEAIAALAVPDVRTTPTPLPPEWSAAAFSGDLSRCAALDAMDRIRVFEMPGAVDLATLPSPTGDQTRLIALYCDHQRLIRLFDRHGAARRLEVWRIPEAELLLAVDDVPDRASFDVTADGRTLAIGRADRAIHLYDMLTGAHTHRIELDREPSYLSFDPAGTRLARFHARDEKASVLDLETGDSTSILEEVSVSYALEWTPDGSHIIAAATDSIHVWDVGRRREVAVLSGHDSVVDRLMVSADGRWLVSSGWDMQNVWDLATARPILRPAMNVVAIHSSDRRMAGVAASEGRWSAAVGDLEHGTAFDMVSAGVGAGGRRGQSGTLHPSGRLAAIGAGDASEGRWSVHFIDVAARRPIGRMDCHGVPLIRFTDSGSHLFSADARGLFRRSVSLGVSSVRIGPAERLAAEPTHAFGASADGRRVTYVSASDSELVILDVESQLRKRSYRTGPSAQIVVVSPDGRWAAVNAWLHPGAEIWDLDAGRVVVRLDVGARATLTFSSCGRWLVVHEPSQLARIRVGHWEDVRLTSPTFTDGHVSYSSDGRRLIGYDERGVLHMVDLESLVELAAFTPPDPGGVVGVTLSADGATLAAFSFRGAFLQVWDIRRIRSELAAMGLDWDDPPCPAVQTDRPATPLRLVLESGDGETLSDAVSNRSP